MRIAKAALWALPGVIAFSPAYAQERRRLDIELQGRAAYDSNVAKADKTAAKAAGIDPSDTILSPQIAADILLPLSRQSFFLRGVAARDYYDKNDFYNTNRFDLTGGFNLHAGLCDGALTDSYQRSRDPAQAVALISQRNVSSVNAISFNATCGRSVGFAPSVSVSHSRGDNTLPLLTSSDFESWSGTAGLAYRRSGFGRLEVYGQHSDTEYRHRLVLVGSQLMKDGYQIDGGGVRYERRLGARLGGEAHIAYTNLKPDLPGSKGFKGATYGVTAEYRATSRIQTRLSLQREALPTTELGAAYTIANTVRADATYNVGSRLKLEAAVQRSSNRYEGAALIGGSSLTHETTSAVSAGARWEVNRRAALLADARWEKRNANVTGLDYSSARVGVGVVAKF